MFRHKITVIYKSGARQTFYCKDFTAKMRNGEVHEVSWEKASPVPMYFGVNDVAAIWRHR